MVLAPAPKALTWFAQEYVHAFLGCVKSAPPVLGFAVDPKHS